MFLARNVACCQQDPADWQQQILEAVRLHQLEAAVAVVDRRLELNGADMEAHGWRGRLLAWQGHWAFAENEYRQVLDQFPNDTEILCGLADVLVWEGKAKEALTVVDRARDLDPTQPDILLRRARILLVLQDPSAARSQYRELLGIDADNREAKTGLAGLASESRHELRIGSDGSTFNTMGPAADEEVYLTSRWTRRFTTTFNPSFTQRFGQNGDHLLCSTAFRFAERDWLTAGAAFANHQTIIPEREMFLEYGHGFQFSNQWVRGLEASYHQHWFWYLGAHVMTLNGTQLYYFPRDWTWTISMTGARSGFSGTGIEWVPSGYTRLGFPLFRTLSGNVTFANGTEDFAQVDQIGRFSAHTYGGGLKYRLTPREELQGYVAVQDRSAGQTENSFGLSYAFRF